MKKFLAVLLIVVMMLSMSTAVFAQSTGNLEPRATRNGMYLEKNINYLTDEQKTDLEAIKDKLADWENLTQEQKIQLINDLETLILKVKLAIADKKADYLKFKLQIQPLVSEIRGNNIIIWDLGKENKEIRKEIRAKLEYLKDQEGYTLPEDVSTKLAEIKTHMQAINDTRGNIKGIIEGNKANLYKMDYEKVVESFQNVITTQEARIEHLNAINTLLKEINELLPAVPEQTEEPDATEAPATEAPATEAPASASPAV